jgi:7-carboxy-7-deazaguanine synthase
MLSANSLKQTMAERMSPLREKRDKKGLLLHEIYASIQGESSHMGKPCVFIRAAGCHLRCSYCDTEHAFFQGTEMTIDDIIKKVMSFDISLVELTGGEPLLQPPSLILLDRLVDLDFVVLLETSGALPIAKINKAVKVILDIKTPASSECDRNVYSNLDILWPGCEVKFVISSLNDYSFAKSICEKFDLYRRTAVLFSPVVQRLDPKVLVDWLLKDRLDVRFQMQLHRVLYGEEQGR